MSWFAKARELVVKYGRTVGAAVKHVATFVPGGAVVGDLIESAIRMSAEAGRDQIEAEVAMKHLATANELQHLTGVFNICLGELSKLVEAVQLHDDEPDEAIQKLIITQLATDQAVRDGFAQLSREVQRFERIESKLDNVLDRLGYSGDLQASMRLLVQQQQAMLSFIEELRAAGVAGRQFTEVTRMMHSALTALSAGKPAEAVPTLEALEERYPQSAAVAEAEAVQAALSEQPARAGAKLTQAAKWRPSDPRLADVSRRVTRATSKPEEDTGSGGAGDGWRQQFRTGALIDGWTTTGLLGEGGMGSVFAVKKGNEVRAMKVLPPALSNDSVFAAQFRKEILILNGLHGLRHVVAFHDFGRDVTSGCWHFQMEHVAGESLQTKLDRDGPLTVATVAFSPDGRLLATASADKTAKVWRFHTTGEKPDWTFSEVRLPAKPRLTFASSGNGVVYPGDLAWIHFRLENAGKGELVRVWAELQSSSKAFHDLTSVLGKVAPGEVAERCIAVVLPTDTPPGQLEVELVFHDAHKECSQSRPVHFDVRALPRPDFPLGFRVVNDGSGNSRGSGDGRPKRGEWIDVIVNLENHTGEDLHDLDATLTAVKVGAGIEVKVPKDAIGDLPDGNGYEARLTVRLDAKAATGPAAFEVRVGTRDGRTFAIETVTMTVE